MWHVIVIVIIVVMTPQSVTEIVCRRQLPMINRISQEWWQTPRRPHGKCLARNATMVNKHGVNCGVCGGWLNAKEEEKVYSVVYRTHLRSGLKCSRTVLTPGGKKLAVIILKPVARVAVFQMTILYWQRNYQTNEPIQDFIAIGSERIPRSYTLNYGAQQNQER